MESLGEGVVALDDEGRVTFVNPAAERMLGWTEAELLGQGMHQMTHFRYADGTPRPPTDCPLLAVRTTGTTIQIEHDFFIRKDGSTIPLSYTSSPIVADGSVTGLVVAFRDMTAHHQIEGALRESEKRNAAILAAALDCIITIDNRGFIREWNQAACETFGYRQDEAVGRDMSELIISPSLRDAHRAGLSRYLTTGDAVILDKRIELTATRSDGLEFPVELTVTRLPLEGPPLFTGYIRDISDRRRVEKETARSARLAAFSADVGIALTQHAPLQDMLQQCAAAIVRHLDAAFARVWTLNEREHVLELQASAGMYTRLDGSHSRVPVGTLKIGRIAQLRRPHLTNQVVGDPHVSEQEWARREGMVSFAGYPLVVGDRLMGVIALFARHELEDDTLQALESVANAIAVGIDRSHAEIERDRARIEADAQRRHLYDLFMQAPALIAVLRGPNHIYELANPHYRQIIGWQECVGHPVREVLPDIESQGIVSLLDRVYDSGKPFAAQEMAVHLAEYGAENDVYLNFVLQPMHDPGNHVDGVMLHAVDVTDQVRARQEVEQLAAEWKATLAQIADGVVVADANGYITFINEAGQRLFGTDATGAPIAEPNDDYELLAANGEPYPQEQLPLARAIRGREVIEFVDLRVRRRSGVEIIIQVSAAPILSADGTLLGGAATFRDVTPERDLNQQKDDFLSAAAHDLKTPLTTIRGITQLLQRRMDRTGTLDPDQTAQSLQRINDTTEQMTALINELLETTQLQMGHPVDLLRQPVDLVALVNKVVAEIQVGGHGQTIAVEGSMSTLEGPWDSPRLQRVLTNLLSNAIKYSPRTERITVTLARERDDDGSHWAVVTIQDRGIGIPADDLPRIFDRFYRARNVGRNIAGTGIGLAAARQTVEKHGGSIEATSREGEGTTMTVRLPLDSPGRDAHTRETA
ncbi:MAG: hypothetical protein NVS4B2_08680 [Chloroflexota bacterium]